jgi:hypothetical protein
MENEEKIGKTMMKIRKNVKTSNKKLFMLS